MTATRKIRGVDVKRILLHYPDGNYGKIFDPCTRDNCNDPYIKLNQRMRDLGYDLCTSDDHSVIGSEWVLFFDAYSVYLPTNTQRLVGRLLGHGPSLRKRDVYQECLDAGLEHRMALFLFEAPAVLPSNWNSRLHARFPIIFTWHDGYLANDKFHEFRVPQPCRFPTVSPQPFSAKKLLVNLSSNKFSNHPRELYSERRTSIRHFEQTRPADFDLYGPAWDQAPGVVQRLRGHMSVHHPSYHGTVTHKWEVYPHYRFALCYENIRDEPGYITEKIFDCMRADCVPIYWGASNIIDYIPSDTFIDRRRFATNEDLENYLVQMSEGEYEGYRAAIRGFLASDRFLPFLEDAFADQVVRVLRLERAS